MSESFDQIVSLMSELSFSDKLRLNAELATSLKKEGKTGPVGKGVKKEKKEGGEKRVCATGTLAWFAFVKHCKETMSDRFEDIGLEKDRLVICKAIRAEDDAAYKTFVENFKAEHASSESEPEPVPEPVQTKEQKMAALKAAMAKKPVVPAAAAPAKTTKKPAAAPAAPKKAVKKAAPKKEKEEEGMPKITVEGETYYYDSETTSLWKIINGDEFGPMIGYYKPDNDEGEQIEFADSLNE